MKHLEWVGEEGRCRCWQDCRYFYQDPWPKCQKEKNLEEVDGEIAMLDECEGYNGQDIPLFSIPEELLEGLNEGSSSPRGELIPFKPKDPEGKE